MNSKKEVTNNNFLENQLRAKEFLKKEKEEKEKHLQKISFFKNENSQNLFENTGTILKDQEASFSIAKIDFIYCKLNVEYLESLGIHLKFIHSEILTSKSNVRLEYIEYYLSSENSCIIFVKYYFKHVRLLSENNKTNLNTFVFVNSKNDIYYYDVFSGCQLLNQFETDMDVRHAKEILLGKIFKRVFPTDERIYLISNENLNLFEEKKLKDIHLVPKQLFDILHKENDIIPEDSEIKVETHFVEVSKAPVLVQTEVFINQYSGIIETSERLLEYEFIVYFSDFPEKKLKAKFYLTEAEKNQILTLTDEHLRHAVLEEFDDKFSSSAKECFLLYKDLYKKHFIDKNLSRDEEKSLQANIAKIIYQNTTIENSLYEYPLLKDSFKKIYVEFFKIYTENFLEEYSFKQIKENKIVYDNQYLVQTGMYYIVYQNAIYLAEISSKYDTYAYKYNSFIIYLPAFVISTLNINIFKPISSKEIDEFVSGKLTKDSSERLNNYSFSFPKLTRDSLKQIFPDFDIKSNGKQSNYKITHIDTESIYSKVLNCIQNPKVSTSVFHFSTCYPFGYDDEETVTIKFPISSNGIIYGYYFDDKYHIKTINSSFTDSDYTYSTGDNLFKLEFESNVPSYKTTFYHLVENYLNLDSFKIVKRNISDCELFKYCIDFFIEQIEQNFSE